MRFVHVLTALTLVACGAGRSTFARYPNSSVTFDRTAQDPKALEIVDRVIAAAGGTQRWGGAKQVRWSVSVVHDGKEVIAGMQAWDRWNGRHHARAKREEGDIVVMRELYEDTAHAFMDNGQRLRKIEGGSEQAIKIARERWEFDSAVLFMPFLLVDPGTKLEYAGETLGEDGKPRDVIKVTLDPKDRTRTAKYQIVVNRETNLIDRIEIQKAGAAENERLGYAVKQWIDAGGLKYPGTIENLGYQGEVVTFKDLAIGDPDETLFVPPPL